MSPQSIHPRKAPARAGHHFDRAVRRWTRVVVADDARAQFDAAACAGLFAPDPEQAARFDHAALTAAARIRISNAVDSTVLAACAAAVAAHAAHQHHRLGQDGDQTLCDDLADRLRRVGLADTLADLEAAG